MSEPLVIVGNGVAAARLCEELAQRALGRYAVAVIGEEPLRQRDDPNEPRLDFETWRALFRSTCGRYTLERGCGKAFLTGTAWSIDDNLGAALWLPPGVKPDPNSFFKTGGPRVTKQMYNRLNYRNELISVSTKQVMEVAHPSIRSMILASVIGLTALSTADAHPLDSLSPAEISAVVEILRAEGKVTADARYPLIELKEPDKSTVLAWKQGDPGPRVATVNVKAADDVYKGEVDLTAHRVLAWNRASGQPMVLFEEFFGAMDLVLANPEFVAGLAKRGLKADQAFCLPLTAGAFGTPDEAGRRLMKVPCYVKPEGSNFYAKPVEGLLAVVDLAAKKVLKVLDTGVLPVPKDSWGYTEAEVEKRAGMLRPVGNPVVLQQSGGANVQINGSAVSWDIWRFRWRVDKPGLVLSQIEVNDGTRWRSVLYQAHLSEVFVPYMDSDVGWYWRTYMDSGEYGFGIFLSPLRKGVDCPATAVFLPVVVHSDDGSPLEIPDAICIFERNIGDPAWRHYEIFAQAPGKLIPAEGRPATELVVRSASEVGNYDYFIDYVFQQDGVIHVSVGSTGLDAVKGVAAGSMADATARTEMQYGTLIAPNLVGPNHDHFFNFRLDFDIDGQQNTFVRTDLVPAAVTPGLPRRSMWKTKDEMPMSELEGRYKVNPAAPAMYHVMNMGRESALGHHSGYMILPENSVADSLLDTVNDLPARRNAYVEYTFWNTPYKVTERYAGGEYAFQGDGSDSLPAWVLQNRSIHDTDIVTWYNGLSSRPSHGRLARHVHDVAGHHADALQFLSAQSGIDDPQSGLSALATVLPRVLVRSIGL